MHCLLLHLFVVRTGFYMGSIHKDMAGVCQPCIHTLPQDMGKDPLGDVRISETAGVVFTKDGKMRDWIHHVQS